MSEWIDIKEREPVNGQEIFSCIAYHLLPGGIVDSVDIQSGAWCSEGKKIVLDGGQLNSVAIWKPV
jgi:hypothetical protein